MVKFKNIVVKNPGWLIWVLGLVGIWALAVPGFYGASDDLHIGWLHQMDRALRAGSFPPRFVPDLSFGFGYPLFHFVYPFPFYLAEIFHLIGFNLVDSVKLVFGLSLPLSGYLMYRWLRVLLGPGWSLAGGVLYMYTPYRAVDLYLRGAIGEIWSFVWLPLLGWAITRVGSGGGWRWVGVGGLALAGLILTHNITAYMVVPLFGFLAIGLVIWVAQSKTAVLIKLVVTLALGLIGSSYFWLPALIDSAKLKYDTVFNYVDHFPTIVQLLKPYWGYGASVAGPYDGMSFFLGFVNWLVLVVGAVLMVVSWRKLTHQERVVGSWALGSAVLAMVMMNYRSSILWDNLPLIGYFQFPWRFLIVQTLVVPVLLIGWKHLKPEWIWTTGLIILTIGSVGWWFRPQDFLGREDDYYLNRYVPTPLASEEYRQTGEEYLRLPEVTQQRPDRNYQLVEASGAVLKVRELGILATEIDLVASQASKINYYRYYFPGWVATVDGQPAEINAGQPFGQIQVMVPSGEHKLIIRWQETPFRILLDILSLVAIGVLFGLTLKKR